MRNKVVTATVLAGLSMVSGTAFAQTGSFGGNYARVEADSGDTDVYGIDGEAIFELGAPYAVILEGDFTETDDTNATGSVEGHLIARGSNNAWGFFLGAADTEESTILLAGGEYAQFFDGATLAFNLNYATDSDTDVNAFGVNGAYRIFSNDNLRFDIGAGAGQAEAGPAEVEVYSFGVGFEYRFDGTPYSIGAAYSHIQADAVDANVLGVTLRWNFGDTTLKAADRAGKTFTGLGSALQSF